MATTITRRGLSSLRLPPFKLERHFAKYEHIPNLTHLCASDTESLTVRDALKNYADPEVREMWINMSLEYTDVKGHPVLLRELANMYDHYAAASSTTTTTTPPPPLNPLAHLQELAPQEGILLGSLALNCDSSHRVVVTSPGYQSLHQVAASSGAKISHWTPRDDKHGGVQFHVDDLRALVRDSHEPVRAVFVNFPHNPTGCLPTKNEWDDIIEVADNSGAFLFSDEMYHGLEMDTTDQLIPAVSAYPERGISLGGLSKSMGMPGARIGWLACRNEEFMERIASLRDYTTICSSAPSQLLGILALRAREQLQARAREHVAVGRAAVANVMEEFHDDFSWGLVGPKAGPMGWIELRGSASGKNVSSVEYCHSLVEEEGIMLLPSNVYECGGDRHFRIGFGRRDTCEIVERWYETLLDSNHPSTMLLRGESERRRSGSGGSRSGESGEYGVSRRGYCTTTTARGRGKKRNLKSSQSSESLDITASSETDNQNNATNICPTSLEDLLQVIEPTRKQAFRNSSSSSSSGWNNGDTSNDKEDHVDLGHGKHKGRRKRDRLKDSAPLPENERGRMRTVSQAKHATAFNEAIILLFAQGRVKLDGFDPSYLDILEIDISPDGRNATIRWDVTEIPMTKIQLSTLQNSLDRASYKIRTTITSAKRMRVAPRLEWRHDRKRVAAIMNLDNIFELAEKDMGKYSEQVIQEWEMEEVLKDLEMFITLFC